MNLIMVQINIFILITEYLCVVFTLNKNSLTIPTDMFNIALVEL